MGDPGSILIVADNRSLVIVPRHQREPSARYINRFEPAMPVQESVRAAVRQIVGSDNLAVVVDVPDVGVGGPRIVDLYEPVVPEDEAMQIASRVSADTRQHATVVDAARNRGCAIRIIEWLQVASDPPPAPLVTTGVNVSPTNLSK